MAAREQETPQDERKSFAAMLRADMDAQGLSIRALARRMDPNGDPENHRASIHRWLDGKMPSRPNRRRLALALGHPPHRYLEADSDKEADLRG